jgi:hypothetical protein
MQNLLDIRRRIALKKRREKDNEKFEVRDAREQNFFIVDDLLINVYARIVGIHATCVYVALCRHAGKDQICWPSINLLCDELAMTSRSVIRAVGVLEFHHMIQIDKVRGESNIYTMLNKRLWRKGVIIKQYIGKKRGKSDTEGS